MSMKISFLNAPISFQKSLVAKAAVLKDGQTKDCGIYLLDNFEDKDYFKGLIEKKEWDGASFLWKMNTNIICSDDTDKFFVLEDEENKCLGYMQVYERDDFSYKKVSFIETCPTCKNDTKKSNIKYVGETMLAFIAKLSEHFDSGTLIVDRPMPRARGFYENKCGFAYRDYGSVDFEALYPTEFNKFIKQNEEHTKSSIELLI